MRVLPGGHDPCNQEDFQNRPPQKRKIVVAIIATVLLLIFVFAYVL